MIRACRIFGAGEHRLAGSLLDRTRKLTFRLDGIEIPAFGGDTILSALMAAGWQGFAMHDNAPLQLTSDCPLYVHVPPTGGAEKLVIHAARLPAGDGLDLHTLSPVKPKRELNLPFTQKREYLGSLEQSLAAPEPGRDGVRYAASSRSVEANVIVVGGGIAGLSAALEAAKQGLKVRIIDRAPVLGGIADYFGRAEGEPAPEDVVAELRAAIAAEDAIATHLHAEVTSVADGAVVALVTDSGEYGAPSVTQLTLRAPHIVLATGGREKLPLFAGNRAVGVVPSIEAWRLASLYGVFQGKTAQIATAATEPYRFAMALADAGIAISRILDSRPDPASRFVAFAKAYGVRLAFGAEVFEIARDWTLTGPLTIRSRVTVADSRSAEEKQIADALIVSAGLQPELTLYLQAGGMVAWDEARQSLLAASRVPGLALAGLAAGARTLEGTRTSGVNAVRALLRQKPVKSEERLIDPDFESPDGAWPMVIPATRGALPGYYDTGASIATIPAQSETPGMLQRLFTASASPREAVALSIVAAAAKVATGEYEAQSVPIAAAERIVEGRSLRHESLGFVERPSPAPAFAPDADGWSLPDYLAGRFGSHPALYLLKPADQRLIEAGRLIFASSDLQAPEDAIGVSLGAASSAPGLSVVLAASKGIEPGQSVSIADLGARVPGVLERLLRRL